MTPLSQLSQLSTQWPALSELLDEALESPAAERDAWLAALTGERAAYRETLRALLATLADVETGDFMAAMPTLSGAPGAAPAGPPGDMTAGATVGAYRLVSELGRGGMGTVWLAERTDTLTRRRVALKLPRVVWGNIFAERLAREREILASLEHEHIARLYDGGVDAQGRPFLAMQYVEGEPIDAYCKAHALSLPARIGLLLQTMAAVSHAHARLVVHRDLKPGNVLVTADGQVQLLDFGIAKLLADERTQATALTEFGGRALTPDYASPEQIRGEPLGTASDIYSLAVLAYELLAEARPYRLKRGSAAELEEAIAAAEPLQASAAAATPALRKALRGDLDAILHRGLKKSVAERYPSVDAFAQDLGRHLRGEPVLARPDSLGYRAGKFVRRHRLAVAMGTALSLSVVVGSGVALWQAQLARQQERRAVTETDRQTAVANLYIETMSRLAVLATDEPAVLARPHAVTGVLREQLRELAPRYKDRPAQLEAQMQAVALQLNYSNEFEASLDVGREYLAHLLAHGAPPVEVISTYALQARTLYQLKRLDDCETMRRAGVAYAPGANDEGTELTRLGLSVDLVNVLRARGKRAEALAVLNRTEAVAARRFPNNLVRFDNLLQRAVFWLDFDDARALDAAQRSHDGLVADGTADDDVRANDLRFLGDALVANGRGAEAEAALRQSADLYDRVFGHGSRNTVRAIGRLAGAIARRGDVSRAEQLLADMLRGLSEPDRLASGVEHEVRRGRLDIAWLTGNADAANPLTLAEAAAPAPRSVRNPEALLLAQARLLTLTGRGRDALALLDKVRAGWPETGQATAGRVQLLELQAGAELAAGEPAAARATARALLVLLEQNDARGGRPYRVGAELAALAAARLGDRPAAEQALARAQQASGVFPSSVESAESALRRGETLALLGRHANAAALGRAALAELRGQHPGSPRLAQAQRLAATP